MFACSGYVGIYPDTLDQIKHFDLWKFQSNNHLDLKHSGRASNRVKSRSRTVAHSFYNPMVTASTGLAHPEYYLAGYLVVGGYD